MNRRNRRPARDCGHALECIGTQKLMIAAMLNNAKIFRQAFEDHGVPDVNTLDRYGNSALHYAAAVGHADMIKLLIAAGAEPDVRQAPDAQDAGSIARAVQDAVKQST